jgi:hypothetical protein
MRESHYVIGIALLLLVLALIWGPAVEGFQTAAPLPTGTQTVTDFVIYAPMNTIAEKLPFLHSNFTIVNSYATTGLTPPLTMIPTTGATKFMDMRELITSDNVPKLYSFKLKSAITGPIDQSAVDALNSASTTLFGATGKIAYLTSNGNLFPSISWT